MTTTKNSSIHLLDELTINQIAAGEVIENSASCVKELVENALDAAATLITIETKRGGQELIIVSDNGHGMNQEELELAIVRHATSKITSAQDLWSLHTLGFRGEALASIAAVAKVKIISAQEGQKVAHEVNVERGEIVAKGRTSRTRGTTIIVASLFYNVYARAAFQKTVAAQTQKIATLLTNLALFAEGVGFEWISDGKQALFVAPQTNLQERIALLLGENFAKELLPIEYTSSTYSFVGFMGNLTSHRSNRLHQHLSINGRLAWSKIVSNGVAAAYDRRIPEGRFIPFVGKFFVPSESLDVNVHPQKKEVRFKEDSKIESFFMKAVNTLFAVKEPLLSFAPLPICSLPSFQRAPFAKIATLPKELPSTLSLHIHKLLGSYAIVEVEQLYIIDLARASHYLLEESMKDKLNRTNILPAQRLLLPQTYSCSLAEAEIIEGHLDLLKSFGFELRPFGKGSFIIESICPQYDLESTLELLQNLYLEKKALDKESLAQILCTRVARRNYTLEQARAVALSLFAMEGPYCLRNGKAVTFALTKENLQKIFR